MEVFKKKSKPKKPCLVGLVLSLFLVVELQAQTVEQDLTGLGMKAEQAEYLAGIIPGGAALDNATFLKGNNQAGSADINLIGIDSSDNTIINSSAGDLLILRLEDDASRLISLSAASDTALVMTFGDSGTTATQGFNLVASTADADDDAFLGLGGGGDLSSARGAFIAAFGNESAGGGDLQLSTGVTAGSIAHLTLGVANGSFEIRDAATTPFATFNNTAGKGLGFDDDYAAYTAPYIATVATALTPAAGVSEMKPNTVIAAAGPTAQAIGIFGTPVPGQIKVVKNKSANPLIVASMGTPVINGGTNRTTSVAAGAELTCFTNAAATSYDCETEALVFQTPIGG